MEALAIPRVSRHLLRSAWSALYESPGIVALAVIALSGMAIGMGVYRWRGDIVASISGTPSPALLGLRSAWGRRGRREDCWRGQ
jgi:hypothetical protein